MRVLIVGAGLGGLCLAHGLRQAHIDVQVLERRPGPADQPSSYGIHLNADGLRALHACLPAANWQELIESSVPAPDLVRFHDEQLRVLGVRNNETPKSAADPITRRRAIRRDALRDALLLGLNTVSLDAGDPVQWGKQFQRYTEALDGPIQVHCTDGSVYFADLVVGADGSNSRVRAQLLPALERQDLDILNIAGRIPLTLEVRRRLPPSLVDGAVNNVVPARPGWLFVSTWTADAEADFTEFAVWAWVAERGSYPTDIDSFTPAELLALVSGKVSDWSPALRYLIAQTDAKTVAPVPLRTMPTLPAWSPSTITVLGDAIHNMTPMAGIGANTALRDADELRRALVAPGAAGITGRVGQYEQHMRVYANQALALSSRNARNAASPARLPRLAFRTVLRLAEVVPPLKRRLFGPTGSAGRGR